MSNLKVDVRRYLLIGLGAVAVKAYSEMRYHQGQVDARNDIDKRLKQIIINLEGDIEKHKEEA